MTGHWVEFPVLYSRFSLVIYGFSLFKVGKFSWRLFWLFLCSWFTEIFQNPLKIEWKRPFYTLETKDCFIYQTDVCSDSIHFPPRGLFLCPGGSCPFSQVLLRGCGWERGWPWAGLCTLVVCASLLVWPSSLLVCICEPRAQYVYRRLMSASG